MLPSFGVVVLTMGRRPDELRRGLDSVLAQRDVTIDMVVVGNGWDPVDLPEGVRAVFLPENVGIPAGRNAGVPHVQGRYLFFLDDDAWLLDEGFLAECARRLEADPTIGMIQPRIVDPDHRGEEPTRWVPRIRKGDPGDSGEIFALMEMAVVLPRAVFDETGGWPGSFFYAHEGIELAWRVWDTGRRVWYAGDLQVGHPVMDPSRHDEYFRLNARNRVWLARRCLPWPVSWAYVGSWTGVQLARWWRTPRRLAPWFAGWRAGWVEDPRVGDPRPKLRWRTVAAMGRHGRLPII